MCDLRKISVAADNSSHFHGNTILLVCEDNGYVKNCGFEIFNIKTDDKIIDYISLMGNNMIPYAIINGKILHIS